MKKFKYAHLALYTKGWYKVTYTESGDQDLFADFRKYLDDYILTTDADVYQKALAIASEYSELFKWDIQTFINNVHSRMSWNSKLNWHTAVLEEVFSAIQGINRKYLVTTEPDYTKFEESD